MDKRHSKKHRHDSSSDEEEVRHRKHHKHHHGEDDHSKGHRYHRSSPDQHSRKHRKDHSRRREGRHAEYDPNIRIKQERDAENFGLQQRERSNYDARRRERRQEMDRRDADIGLNNETEPVIDDSNADVKPEPKENPNFGLSGKLTEDTNTFRGVVIKYNEPPEAMMPKRKWRLYPFKGETALPVLHIHRQSAFLLGRDRKIADIPVDHPSCSKQQAVLQYRAVNFTRDDGSTGRRVRPFIIDLESSNGTYLNSDKIEARRYYELKEKDVLKFGFSTREYVLLHDNVDLSEVTGRDVDDL